MDKAADTPPNTHFILAHISPRLLAFHSVFYDYILTNNNTVGNSNKLSATAPVQQQTTDDGIDFCYTYCHAVGWAHKEKRRLRIGPAVV